jgi:MinD superfamily P-loop ATPase
MKEIVIISGKGGTGKTSVAGALATLAARTHSIVLTDADVDAPDLHLLLQPVIQRRERFTSGWTARIKPGHCTACGKCEELCRFEAVSFTGPGSGTHDKTFAIDPIACEGCGVCAEFCQDHAIELTPADRGEWFISDTRCGPFVHARLEPGGANSGKLVSLVRRQARDIATNDRRSLMLTDGAPGVGCPVIASLTGASLALLVTEPTPAGWHDVARVLDLADHFHLPTALIINKWDLYPDQSTTIERQAEARHCPVIGRIGFDTSIVTALMHLQTIPEALPGPRTAELSGIWQGLQRLLSL